MRSRIAPIQFAVVALSFALPLAAQAESSFKLFAGAVWATPIDDSSARLDGETGVVELDDDIGWEAGFEWRLTPSFGIEAAIARTSHDVDFGATQLGTVELEPIFLSFNIHLVRTARTDWWIAPTFAYFEWRDDGFDRGVEIDEDADEAWGGTFGMEYRFGERWSVSGAVRYIDMQLAFAGGGEVAVDPLSVRAAVGFTF